ncbi:MAG: response regulator [Phycisphaerae bacterium]|nr:response regulator [Phycisphaerae bacterium]
MQDGKHVILCVDDDQDVLEYLTTVLQTAGYQVLTAMTGEDGVKVFQTAACDLVIVDLMMEEVDAGTNFVRELRAQGCKVPIYMLSSMGDNLNDVTDYSALGLAGVLQKPLDSKKLLALLSAKLK